MPFINNIPSTGFQHFLCHSRWIGVINLPITNLFTIAIPFSIQLIQMMHHGTGISRPKDNALNGPGRKINGMCFLFKIEGIDNTAGSSPNTVHEPFAIKGRDVRAPAGADDLPCH